MRLIDADALKIAMEKTLMPGKDVIMETYFDEVVQAVIDEAPTIEAEPVRHGEWSRMVFTDSGKHAGYKCSECGRIAKGRQPYCHCGSKMDGGNENDRK